MSVAASRRSTSSRRATSAAAGPPTVTLARSSETRSGPAAARVRPGRRSRNRCRRASATAANTPAASTPPPAANRPTGLDNRLPQHRGCSPPLLSHSRWRTRWQLAPEHARWARGRGWWPRPAADWSSAAVAGRSCAWGPCRLSGAGAAPTIGAAPGVAGEGVGLLEAEAADVCGLGCVTGTVRCQPTSMWSGLVKRLPPGSALPALAAHTVCQSPMPCSWAIPQRVSPFCTVTCTASSGGSVWGGWLAGWAG